MNKIEKILKDIEQFEEVNFDTNVKERLDKTFNLYLHELNDTYTRLSVKKDILLLKRLSK